MAASKRGDFNHSEKNLGEIRRDSAWRSRINTHKVDLRKAGVGKSQEKKRPPKTNVIPVVLPFRDDVALRDTPPISFEDFKKDKNELSKDTLLAEIRAIDERDLALRTARLGNQRAQNVLPIEEDEIPPSAQSAPSNASKPEPLFRKRAKDDWPYKRKSSKKPALYLVGIIAVLIIGAAAKSAYSQHSMLRESALAFQDAGIAYDELSALNAERAEIYFKRAERRFESAEQSFGYFERSSNAVFSRIVPTLWGSSSIHIARAGKAFSGAGAEISGALAVVQEYATEESDAQYYAALSDAQAMLQRAKNTVSLMHEEIALVNPDEIPRRFRDDTRTLKDNSSSLTSVFSEAFSDLGVLLTFLGYEGEKTYLLILQDPSEARPTGGAIRSYAVMNVERGRIENVFADSAYNADARLTANVIPPEPLRAITSGWTMHNANWFFDFPLSAQKAAWFFEKSGEAAPDAVIFATPKALERVLAAIGPVPLAAQDIEVESGNLEELLWNAPQAGDSQNRISDAGAVSYVLPAFFTALEERFSDSSPAVLEALLESAKERDLLLYSSDLSVQSFVDERGWSGRLPQDTAADYAAVVPTGIGGEAVAGEISYEYSSSIEYYEDGREGLPAGREARVLTITARHQGTTRLPLWRRSYEYDYLRVYVPAGSRLIEAEGFSSAPRIPQFDYEGNAFSADADVASTIGSAEFRGDVAIFEESAKSVFGGWVGLRQGEEASIIIRYATPDI